MAKGINVQITSTGATTGPFNLYTNIDNYTASFANNVSKNSLTSGAFYVVDDSATIVRVKSVGTCTTYSDFTIVPAPTRTPTPTPSPTPTTTPTPTPTITPTPMNGQIYGRNQRTDSTSVSFNVWVNNSNQKTITLNAGGANALCSLLYTPTGSSNIQFHFNNQAMGSSPSLRYGGLCNTGSGIQIYGALGGGGTASFSNSGSAVSMNFS